MALVGRGRLRLLPLAATVQPEVSSPGLRPFLAEPRNPGLHRPPLRCGPAGAAKQAPASNQPSRPRMSAGFGQPQEKHHGKHRHIQEVRRHNYTGEIVTMSLQKKNVTIVAEPASENENAPSHRVFVGRGRDRRRLAQDQQGRPRLPLDQARRSQLHRPDLRQPVRRRRWQDLQLDLVTRPHLERQLTQAPTPRPALPGGALACSSKERNGNGILELAERAVRSRQRHCRQLVATPRDINPATGLPMVGGIGSIDMVGNPFGTNQDHWHSHDGIPGHSSHDGSFDSW